MGFRGSAGPPARSGGAEREAGRRIHAAGRRPDAIRDAGRDGARRKPDRLRARRAAASGRGRRRPELGGAARRRPRRRRPRLPRRRRDGVGGLVDAGRQGDRLPGKAWQGRGALALRDPGGGRRGPADRRSRDRDHVLRLQPRRQARRVPRQGRAAEGPEGSREEGIHPGGRGREREARPHLGAFARGRVREAQAAGRAGLGVGPSLESRRVTAGRGAGADVPRGRRLDGASGRDRGRRLGRGDALRQPGKARPDGVEHGRPQPGLRLGRRPERPGGGPPDGRFRRGRRAARRAARVRGQRGRASGGRARTS